MVEIRKNVEVFIFSNRRCGTHILVSHIKRKHKLHAGMEHQFPLQFNDHAKSNNIPLIIATRTDLWQHCLSVCYAEATSSYALHSTKNTIPWEPRPIEMDVSRFLDIYCGIQQRFLKDLENITVPYQFVTYEDLLVLENNNILQHGYLQTPVPYVTLVTNAQKLYNAFRYKKTLKDELNSAFIKLRQNSANFFPELTIS